MRLGFRFGCGAAVLDRREDSVTVALPNPVLEGPGDELWAREVATAGGGCGAFTLYQHDHRIWGAAMAAVGESFAAAARDLYRDLFHAAGTRSVYRIWNFIPRINDADDGLENYRAFCGGRSTAFEERFAAAREQQMPAASAVGTTGEHLCVVFLAGTDPVRYVENPHQVPAYHYPPRYGPKAPSFARASVVDAASGAELYVSGTASIRGSESLHPGDVSAQLELALDNVHAVARAAGFAAGLDAESPGQRSFRLYVRQAEDSPAVRRVLERRLLRPADQVNVVQADICRRELLVEIEARVTAGAAGSATY